MRKLIVNHNKRSIEIQEGGATRPVAVLTPDASSNDVETLLGACEEALKKVHEEGVEEGLKEALNCVQTLLDSKEEE